MNWATVRPTSAEDGWIRPQSFQAAWAVPKSPRCGTGGDLRLAPLPVLLDHEFVGVDEVPGGAVAVAVGRHVDVVLLLGARQQQAVGVAVERAVQVVPLVPQPAVGIAADPHLGPVRLDVADLDERPVGVALTDLRAVRTVVGPGGRRLTGRRRALVGRLL